MENQHQMNLDIVADEVPVKRNKQAKKWTSRHNIWLRVLSAVLVVAILSSTVLGVASSAKITGQLSDSITQQVAYDYLTQGLAYLQMNRYEQALEYLQVVLDLTPKNAEAYAARASVYIATADYEKAVADLQQAILYYGDEIPTDLLLQLASIYVLQGDSAAAIPLLDAVTQQDPTQSNGWLLLGQIYYEAESYALAVECLDKYLAEYPDDVTSRAVRAACRSALGDEDGAMEDLILAAEKSDEYPEIRTALAQVYLNLGQYAEAAAVYEILVEASPEDTDNRQILAACYLYAGNYQGAKEQFEAVYDLLSKDEQAGETGQAVQFSIAVIGAELGQLEEAIAIYETLLAAGYETASVQAQLANAYIQIEGREDEAFALWDELLAWEGLSDTDCTTVSSLAAEAALQRARYDEAIAYANICLATTQPDESARLYRAVAYLETSQDALALVDLDLLVENNPDIANVRYYRAIARLRLGDTDGAIEDLELCMKDTDEADIALAAYELKEAIAEMEIS
ncbi:MAG: tetratricopeptide repeat protein [Faecalibacterium sp.]